MTRVDARLRGSAPAIVRASSPASAGVVCIFQLAATITSRIARIMPERGSAAGTRPDGAVRRAAGPRRSSGWSASRSIRSSARWTAERWSSSRSASSARRRLRRLAAGVGDEPDDVRLVGEPAVRLELGDRVELPAGRADRPLEVRRLGVEDPVELAAQRPRHLARLELEQRAGRPDPAQERARPPRRSSRSRRRGRDAAATTPAARARRAAPRGRGASSGATTNSRWVRPPARLSEPRARNRPRSQAVRQCSAAAAQSNGGRGRRSPAPPAAPSRTASRATGRLARRSARRRARPPRPRRSHGRDGSIAASSARSAVTRSRSARLIVRRSGATGRRGAALPRLALEQRG